MPDQNQEANARTIKELFDGYVRLYIAAHGAARAYANLMMAVGYAGVFGIWSLTREHLPPSLGLWAAILLLISLSTFVLFEVFRTFRLNRASERRGKLLFNNEDSLGVRVANIERFEAENAEDESRFNHYALVAWSIAVIFGVLAIGALLFSLLCSLVSHSVSLET